MKQRIKLLLLSALAMSVFGFVSCKKALDDSQQQNTPEFQKEIKLRVADMVDAAAVTQTKAAASDKNDEMSVRLVSSAATKAAPSETEIKNYWVLQFESDAPDAKLAAKAYAPYERYRVVEGSGQRLVIVANTFDENFGKDMTVGTSTYTELIAKNYRLASSPASATDAPDLWRKEASGARGMIFVGDTIVASMVEGMDLNLNLYRIVAKVTLKVKLTAATEGMTDWAIQFCGLNRNVYYNAQANLPVGYAKDPSKVVNAFPVNADTINYTPMVYNTFNTADFTTVQDVYIPVNCRGQANEVLLSSNRRTYAPKMSAYAYMRGELRHNTSTGTTNSYPSTVVEYYIHLASDGTFLKDYNVLPNTHYTFEITLDRKPISTDSRLVYERIYEPTTETYVGLAGGEIIGAGTAEDPYRAKYRLILKDAFGGQAVMSTVNENASLYANDMLDGKKNTYNLVARTGLYPAATMVYNMNAPKPTSIDDPNYQWFLPSFLQMMMTKVTRYNHNTLTTDPKMTLGLSTFTIPPSGKHEYGYSWTWASRSSYGSYGQKSANYAVMMARHSYNEPKYGFQSPYKQ